jgi:hypothetical protein
VLQLSPTHTDPEFIHQFSISNKARQPINELETIQNLIHMASNPVIRNYNPIIAIEYNR